MQIDYDQKNSTLVIRDGLKQVYGVLKILMVVNIFMALVFFLNLTRFDRVSVLAYLFVALGVAALIVLILLLARKSTREVIPIDEIQGLREKKVLGKTTYGLKLRNGKVRDLTKLKSEVDVGKLRELLDKAGVPQIQG